VLLNIDNIPYIGQHSTLDFRTEHLIALKISEYLSDTPVFYIEFFSGPDLFQSDISEYIDSDTLSQIRSGNIHIAFHNIHEAFHNIGHGIVMFLKKHDIPTEHAIIITSNHDLRSYTERTCERQGTVPPRIVLVEVFEIQSTMTLDIFKRHCGNLDAWIKMTHNPSDITHRYLNLNRRQRSHRTMLVTALLARESHTLGKISFGNSDFDEAPRQSEIIDNAPFYWMDHPDVRAQVESKRAEILKQLPLYLDTTDLVTNRAASEISDAMLYKTTGISVVSETTFFTRPCQHGTYSAEPGVFLSEKAWKPIIHFQPWVMVSQPYTQQAMKAKGYQTFSELWDESYDYETSDTQRMWMIVQLIEKIVAWDNTKFRDILSECQKISEHNIKLLESKTQAKDFCREL